jgi:hypothetical protein
MVTRAAPGVALLLVALGAAGCFDVHAVDPGPFVIDDFDDGDFAPADPNFQPWICYGFNPDRGQGYSCDHEPGYQSDFALFLEFAVDDPPDETQQHSGVSLATFANAPQDFSQFSEIVFSARLESGNPPLPSDALLYIELGCSTAHTEDGSQPGDLYIVQGADYKSYWQTLRLTLTSFGSPPWQATHIQGGPAACLQRVDSFRFTIDAQLPDGQSGKGILHVDNITLR